MNEDKKILDFMIYHFKSQVEQTKVRMLDSLSAQLTLKPLLEKCENALEWLEKKKEEQK